LPIAGVRFVVLVVAVIAEVGVPVGIVVCEPGSEDDLLNAEFGEPTQRLLATEPSVAGEGNPRRACATEQEDHRQQQALKPPVFVHAAN